MTFMEILWCFGLSHILFFTVVSVIKCGDYDTIKLGEAVIAHVIASIIAGLLTSFAYSVSYERPKDKISIDDYLPIVGAKYECTEVKGKVYKIKVNVYSSKNSSEIEVPKDTYDTLAIGSIYFKDGNKVANYIVPINGTTPVKKE